jgi:hypothetical protein
VPYVTYAEVAAELKGEARLKDLLEGHAEDLEAAPNEAHPYFDSQEALAARMIDAALNEAGYATPLDAEAPIDPILKKVAAALLTDLLSKSQSNREPWIDAFATWGNEQLELIRSGQLLVIGAEESPEPFDDSEVEGTLADQPLFDRLDLRSPVLSVFPPLGRPRNGSRWDS